MTRLKPWPETTQPLNADGASFLGKDFFLGAFARDTLPLRDMLLYNSPWGLIANTKDHDHPGEHWIAFCWNTRTGKGTTFAQSPSKLGYSKWLKGVCKGRRRFTYNKQTIKEKRTVVCGLCCLHFLWHIRMKKKKKDLRTTYALKKGPLPPVARDEQVLHWAIEHGIDP